MQTGSFERQLKGTVEADETFIGGKAKFMHKSKREERIQGRGTVGKIVVQGVLERDGEVRVERRCQSEEEDSSSEGERTR